MSISARHHSRRGTTCRHSQMNEAPSPVKKLAEVLANLSIVVAAILLCWTLLKSHLGSSKTESNQQAGASLIGTTLPSLPAHKWSQHPATLILAIRGGCHFCEASYPFYRKLNAIESDHDSRAHLLAVMPDDPQSGGQLLKTNDLPVDAVYGEPLTSLNVTGTPTLMLLNSNGVVEKAWGGQLDQEGERSVLSDFAR